MFQSGYSLLVLFLGGRLRQPKKKKKKRGFIEWWNIPRWLEKAEAGRKIVPRDKYSIVMRKTSLRNMICPILLRIDKSKT